MVNNQTSLKLNKLQNAQVSSITKENGKYIVMVNCDWAIEDQKQYGEYNTLKEVKSAIQNIIPFLTTKENDDFKRRQAIRSLKDDYKWELNNGNIEEAKQISKELMPYGIEI